MRTSIARAPRSRPLLALAVGTFTVAACSSDGGSGLDASVPVSDLAAIDASAAGDLTSLSGDLASLPNDLAPAGPDLAPAADLAVTRPPLGMPIVAPSGQLSYLAVAVQSTAKVRLVRLVSPSAFFPRPKIESAVIRLDPLPDPLVPFEQREAFLGVVRAGFTQPRKTLLNSLDQGFGPDAGWARADIRALLDAAQIAPERRPQELSLPEWRALFEAHRQARPASVG